MRSSSGTFGLQYSLSKSGQRLGDVGVGGGGGGGGALCGRGGDGGPAQINSKIWMALIPPQFSDELDAQVKVHPALGFCELVLFPLQTHEARSAARHVPVRQHCTREPLTGSSTPETLVLVLHTSKLELVVLAKLRAVVKVHTISLLSRLRKPGQHTSRCTVDEAAERCRLVALGVRSEKHA